MVAPPNAPDPCSAAVPVIVASAGAGAEPLPDTDAVLVPLVWSALTVSVPSYAWAAVGANRTVTCCDPPGAIAPLVQLSAYPPGTVIPVTDSVPVPLLPTESVNSDAFPSSTAPKFRLPTSEITLEAAEVEVGVEAGVGADGLVLSQAEAARATRRTTRESERTSGHSSIER